MSSNSLNVKSSGNLVKTSRLEPVGPNDVNLSAIMQILSCLLILFDFVISLLAGFSILLLDSVLVRVIVMLRHPIRILHFTM